MFWNPKYLTETEKKKKILTEIVLQSKIIHQSSEV